MHVYATRVDLRTRLYIYNSIHGFAPLGIHRRYSILSKKKIVIQYSSSAKIQYLLTFFWYKFQAGKDM